MTSVHRNQGAALLAKSGSKAAEIAARVGCSRSLVSQWLTGDRKPTRQWRVVLERAYKIAPAAWDRAKAPARVSAPASIAASAPSIAPVPDDAPVDLSSRTLARELARDVMAIRRELALDGELSLLDRIKVIRGCTENLRLLGTITGESLEISEARILRLPALTRVQDALIRALTPWPEALQAAGEELQRLGRDT